MLLGHCVFAKFHNHSVLPSKVEEDGDNLLRIYLKTDNFHVTHNA